MERPTTTMLRVGAWCVDPAAGQISRDGESARLDTRAMRLLLCLAEHPGEVVSIDELLTQVWSGVTVSPDSVYQAVASLRRVLGDDPKQSAYIATVPRLGYRMVATVGPWVSSSTERAIPARSDAAGRGQRFGRFWLWAGGTALCLVLLGALLLHGRTGNTHPSASPAHVAPQRSIAVLPFLDLTEGMHEETFADGMTEELIHKLSKVPEFSRSGSHVLVLFQEQTNPACRYSEAAGCCLCTRWKRTQVRRAAAGCGAADARGRRIRFVVGGVRPAIRRHPDGAG